MNLPKSLLIVTTAVLLVILIGLVLFMVLRPGGALRAADPASVAYEIRQLGELVSVRYLVQDIVSLEKQPLARLQAQVLGGMDLNQVQPGDVQHRPNGQWLVKLPPARILHVNLDDRKSAVWSPGGHWLYSGLGPVLEPEVRAKAIQEIESEAREMGILNDARHNAESTIRALLGSFGIRSVTFVSES